MKFKWALFLILLSSLAKSDTSPETLEKSSFSSQLDEFITGVNEGVISTDQENDRQTWFVDSFFLFFGVDFIFDVNAAGTTVQTTPELIFFYERK